MHTPLIFREGGILWYGVYFLAKINKIETGNVSIEQYEQRVDEIIYVIKEQEGLLKEFDDKIFNGLIDRIEVLELCILFLY